MNDDAHHKHFSSDCIFSRKDWLAADQGEESSIEIPSYLGKKKKKGEKKKGEKM